MDLVSDQLYNGKRLQALTLMNLHNKGCLAIHSYKSIIGTSVVDVQDKLKVIRGLHEQIKVYKGPEFIAKVLDARAYLNKVQLGYSQPGRSISNAYTEYLKRELQ